MGSKAPKSGWERSEVNVKLTKRRRDLLRALLGDERPCMTPTEALDFALHTASRSAIREEEDAKLIEVAQRGFAQSRAHMGRLDESVQALAERIDALVALISDVANSDD